jgi:competence protein ComEA
MAAACRIMKLRIFRLIGQSSRVAEAMAESNLPQPPRSRAWLRHADQAAIALIGAFALVMIGGYWISQAVVRQRMIDIDRADPQSAAFRVDLNSAGWPELAQLPGIGETLARRIIDWRTTHGPFRSLDQLRQISGFGPKRIEAIREYLISPEETESASGRASHDLAQPTKS